MFQTNSAASFRPSEITQLGDTRQPTTAHFEAVSGLNKGLGLCPSTFDAQDVEGFAWNLLDEDLSLPCAVLYLDKLLHNLHWMHRFTSAYGMRLAPHGKTTMAPKLFKMQLANGAWGITLATAQQSRVAKEHGVLRVLMANQLVGKTNMAIVAELIADPGFEFYCLVDSGEQVEQLGRYFSTHQLRLNVLLEVGVSGGRAGVRNEAQLDSVLAALTRWQGAVSLCGVEVYEGVLHDETSIRTLLSHVIEVTRRLVAQGIFQRTPILLSGAGSAWYDIVAEEFAGTQLGADVEIVLRPGCYLTHDAGSYREAQTRIMQSNPVAMAMTDGLVPALHIWTYVQSIPEEGKAIIAMGKRDAAFDSGFPIPALQYRPGAKGPHLAAEHWAITKMMDQHAFLEIQAGDDLRVGDMLAFDICHPCLTFDKWRTLPILDSGYRVVDLVQTYF